MRASALHGKGIAVAISARQAQERQRLQDKLVAEAFNLANLRIAEADALARIEKLHAEVARLDEIEGRDA